MRHSNGRRGARGKEGRKEAREAGTLHSQTSSPSFLRASIDHSDSFLADQSNFCSFASLANSKFPPLFDLVIFCTREMCSRTAAFVPENLKKSVGCSFHTRGAVAPPRLTTFICTSSMISMAATGIPACMTPAAADAASRMLGNVTTATEKSSGTIANFNVAVVLALAVWHQWGSTLFSPVHTFCHDAKGTFRPHEQAVQVVSR